MNQRLLRRLNRLDGYMASTRSLLESSSPFLKNYPSLIPIYRITVWINPKNSHMEKAGEEAGHAACSRLSEIADWPA